MRKDMAKVLVERERQGSTMRYNEGGRRAREKALCLVDDDGEVDSVAHKTIAMKPASYRFQKELNENLQPLKRFLQTHVGRSWNEVYSEIREHFGTNNPVQFHIFQHLRNYVETSPMLVRGEVCSHLGWKWYNSNNNSYYVDAHGILREFPKRVRNKKVEPVCFKRTSPTSAYVKAGCVWYEVTLRNREYGPRYSVTYQKMLPPDYIEGFEVKGHYTTRIRGTMPKFVAPKLHLNPDTVVGWPIKQLATRKRQLSSKELKRLKLE